MAAESLRPHRHGGSFASMAAVVLPLVSTSMPGTLVHFFWANGLPSPRVAGLSSPALFMTPREESLNGNPYLASACTRLLQRLSRAVHFCQMTKALLAFQRIGR